MQGNKRVIEQLNINLANELTAIMQYMVQGEMCSNWGYVELNKLMKGRAIEEMKHAERLIERILFLEGIPIVSELNAIHIGKNAEEMHENDHDAELIAIKGYNEAIDVAVECADNGSRQIFEEILHDEESHIDVIEAQLTQIEQMSLENYLIEQLG